MTFEELEKEIISCRKCPRLVLWREKIGDVKRRAFLGECYWAKPVPGFGDPAARVLVLGLAPGAHGSNRTGRMFTGDASGDFLYPALRRVGFASQPLSKARDDGLQLTNLYITAVCRCVPPDNKPTNAEIINCRPYLLKEMELLDKLEGIVALGKIAYESAVQILKLKGSTLKYPEFGHGVYSSPQPGISWLLASYHPSRQNTQTGRLTSKMFDQIWDIVKDLTEPGLFMGQKPDSP